MMCRPIRLFLVLVILYLFAACNTNYAVDESAVGSLPDQVDFNFHIKPILSDRCFACHGPDKNALKADLRLDVPEGALTQKLSSGAHAFVPGNLKRSEAFQRMISDDPALQMPPPEFQRRLSPYEKALLAKWIQQGAEYKPHWAFIPPQQPAVPRVGQEKSCSNEIDHFVLNKLEQHGLDFNVPASREIWLRRATLDLTGLPPTLAEIDAFLQDKTPNAFEKVVDRLLSSPHYGEKMALHWLDLARYADSNGYSQDGLRIMWPWRDWLINAFNKNLPYDQFLTWQIAGDQLPKATQEQKLATAFLRNHRQNGEGGIIDEEYRVEYVADRTETTATVFLGLTLQCARCHDHKYDPISQKEYYQLFSFFNNIHENGITANDGNSGPELVLTTEEVEEQIAFIDSLIHIKEEETLEIAAELPATDYEKSRINLQRGLIIDLSFDHFDQKQLFHDLAPGEAFDIIGSVGFEDGYEGKAIKTTGYDFVRIKDNRVAFDRADAFSFAFYLQSHHGQHNLSVLNHLGSKGNNFPGYEVAIDQGHATLRFIHSYPAHQIEVRTQKAIPTNEWMHFAFTYDGSGTASGITIYQNGKRVPLEIVYDHLTQGFSNTKKQLTIGGRRPYQTKHDGHSFIDRLKIYNRTLSEVEVDALFHQDDRKNHSDEVWKAHYLATIDRQYQKVKREIQSLRRQKFGIQDTLISVMVMEDLPEPRPTFVLARGAYDAPDQQVYPGIPSAIDFDYPAPLANRHDLANWLSEPQNPLTARVAVNRFWKYLFGRGLVATTDDFGNQGALASHPELLDWLATSFVASGWDVKALLRKVVLSSTYRQSSKVDAEQRANDPDNEWLARGPRQRLSAELIRDVALAASGLLTKRIGGPSVKPYQPKGLWSEKGEFSKLKNYEQSHGSDLYRRSLYTFWRRTSPPPSMTVFDAPTRDLCIANRQETNTPLQALVMLNDPQFVEAARVLAQRVLQQTDAENPPIIKAYRLLTGLQPSPKTVEALETLRTREQLKYQEDDGLCRTLLQVGEHPADPTLDRAATAAMTIVCSTIMSFDETIMKR